MLPNIVLITLIVRIALFVLMHIVRFTRINAVADLEKVREDDFLNSRFPIKMGFKLTSESRKDIWIAHLPEAMPVDREELARVLDDFANIPIDGRQIHQAVQLAATRASNEDLSEIPVEYFLESARQIRDDSKALENTKPMGNAKQKIGFLSE